MVRRRRTGGTIAAQSSGGQAEVPASRGEPEELQADSHCPTGWTMRSVKVMNSRFVRVVLVGLLFLQSGLLAARQFSPDPLS